ncbi:MAG: recombination protein RecR [Parcubacteria group bacterium Gr01-1014_30]|nr:MAG: recombination protein RecR [Parcubacteria group bacterium Gr01-1014_30]
MYPASIQKIIDMFTEFPTVGPRTAARFVFYLLGKPAKEINELISAISNLRARVKTCVNCFNPFEPFAAGHSAELSRSPQGKAADGLCPICYDKTRDKSLLCVVSSEMDLQSLEKTRKYKGFYFVLGGTLATLKKTDLMKLRTKELEERIKSNQDLKEIILALNPTTEGETTVLYLERLLKPFSKKITSLGRGLPVGGELEYADEETLGSALEGRK